MNARYIAAALNLPLNELDQRDIDRMVRRYRKMAWRWSEGTLKVFNWSDRYTTVSMIEALIKRLQKGKNPPHVIIIDYDDLVYSDEAKMNQDPRMKSMAVYNRLKTFVSNNGLLCWLGAQAKREAAQKSRVGADDAAEDINKIRRVAVCITLGIGPHDRTIQFTVAVNRNDAGGISLTLPTAYDRMRFIDFEQQMRNLKGARTNGSIPRSKK
jgi:hypothetical protein